MDAGADLPGAGSVDRRHRRIGAHPPGVGPLVAVEDPLVVLGRGERDGERPVAYGQQRHLAALEVLFDDHALGVEHPPHEQSLECLARLRLVGGDDHALPCGETIGLDHRRVALDRRHAGGGVGDHLIRGRRYPRRLHHLLAERLGSLERGASGARAEARDTGLSQTIGQPGDQWRLGADDDEVDLGLLGTAHEPVEIADAHLEDGGLRCDPGITGRTDDRRAPGRAQQRLDDGVLARPRAYDEDTRRLRSRQ